MLNYYGIPLKIEKNAVNLGYKIRNLSPIFIV